MERRDILIADAEALIVRKLLDGGCLRELTRAHGYKNVAFDLSGLTQLMKTAWPTIEGHTGLTSAELAEVDKLALRLMTVVARREQSPEAIAEATTICQRMYTLFYEAYSQLHRAATYLRWIEDDVDVFVPSMFASRTNAKAGRAGGGDAGVTGEPSPPEPNLARFVTDERRDDEVATELAQQRQRGLKAWGIGEAELASFRAETEIRVITPGGTAGELLHVLSSLERRSARWEKDPESARTALSAAISFLLRLLGRDPDPAKSRKHVLLGVLAERRLRAGQGADLESLMEDLAKPPVEKLGALAVDAFLPRTERRALAAALNTLLASPTFCSWREGTTLDVTEWLTPKHGRTPGVVVSVAHLDDEERALVLGVLLEEVLSWVRTLPGSQRLRALIVFDEVYGFLPVHPANPPTKRPIVALMKQARAFGVGVVVATQNPMDLDYRALSNAGLWWVGPLQTDADRERVPAVPPPRVHQVRYFGVLSSHASLRPEVVGDRLHDDCAHQPPAACGDQLELSFDQGGGGSEHGKRHRWAWLLAHVYLDDLEHCPKCQGPMRWVEVAKTPSAAANLMARMGMVPEPMPRQPHPPLEQLRLPFDT